MTKLSTRLPKDYDENGLDSNSRHLLRAYTSQEYIPVVALVRTKEVLQDEDFLKIPKVEIVHVEGAFTAEDDAEVRALIQRLHDDRVAHIKQPLDLPEEDVDYSEVVRELEAGFGPDDSTDDVVDAEVVDEDQPALASKEN